LFAFFASFAVKKTVATEGHARGRGCDKSGHTRDISVRRVSYQPPMSVTSASHELRLTPHLRTSKRQKGKEREGSSARGRRTLGAAEGAISVLSASQECHTRRLSGDIGTTFCAAKAKESDRMRHSAGPLKGATRRTAGAHPRHIAVAGEPSEPLPGRHEGDTSRRGSNGKCANATTSGTAEDGLGPPLWDRQFYK